MYKMLAINLDGALLSSKGRLNKVTKSTLSKVYHKGVEITLFTNFSAQHALHAAKQLTFRPHIISNFGGFILENSEMPVFIRRINETTAHDIVRLLEKMECSIRLVHEDQILTNSIKFSRRSLSKIMSNNNDFALYIEQYVESLTDHLIVEPTSPLQIDITFLDIEDASDALQSIKSIFSDVAIYNNGTNQISILPKNVSLISSITYFLRLRGINHKEMIAIGSNACDEEIIKLAGLGVATANACEKVKQSADWLTRSNDFNGVSYILQEIFRKQPSRQILERVKKI